MITFDYCQKEPTGDNLSRPLFFCKLSSRPHRLADDVTRTLKRQVIRVRSQRPRNTIRTLSISENESVNRYHEHHSILQKSSDLFWRVPGHQSCTPQNCLNTPIARPETPSNSPSQTPLTQSSKKRARTNSCLLKVHSTIKLERSFFKKHFGC